MNYLEFKVETILVLEHLRRLQLIYVNNKRRMDYKVKEFFRLNKKNIRELK